MEYTFPEMPMSETGLQNGGPHPHPEYPYMGNSDDNMFLDSGIESSFGDDAELAAALANFQPCNDCTPATKTTIPHHHHPSGRLAGASATLDGHFCCSWLVHGQPCFLCFESAEALDNHIKSDHAGKDGSYRCYWQDCCKQDTSTKVLGPMNFGNKPKLMRHVHSHTGYKPFSCPFPGCEKGFVTKEQLKNHETTHTKSRKYKCEQCGKAFAVKSALTTHITAVHDEMKIHSCEICGKAFADSSNLSKHKQTHFRDTKARKQRSRRGTASASASASASAIISTRSSPTASTPSLGPPTPVMQMPMLAPLSTPHGLMAPPSMLPKLHTHNHPFYTAAPYSAAYSALSTTSTTSSPPPDAFDPNCYCCDQPCPPPVGPATPCDEADDCHLDGFCDLPDCLGPDGSMVSSTCCAEAAALSCTCDEPLLPHQIEQLRNFEPAPSPSTASSSWGGFFPNGVGVGVGVGGPGPADPFFDLRGH